MSGINDYKITDTTGYKVQDTVGDTLSGTVQENKEVFDGLGLLTIQHFNNLIDYLRTQGVDDLATWKSNVLKTVYPIGAIYISTSATSPASIFGGTWARIKDTFLLSAGDTYSAGATGGSADAVAISHSHLIGAQTITGGSHSHNFPASVVDTITKNQYGATSGTKNVVTNITFQNVTNTTAASSSHTHTLAKHSTDSAGVSGTGKNMPPYLAVYVWKRTA